MLIRLKNLTMPTMMLNGLIQGNSQLRLPIHRRRMLQRETRTGHHVLRARERVAPGVVEYIFGIDWCGRSSGDGVAVLDVRIVVVVAGVGVWVGDGEAGESG